MSVKKFKDINLNNIVFKKKVSTNLNNAKILIYQDNQSLIFQTPIMFSQYGYSIFGDSKYIDLSLVNLIEFEDFLKKIKNLVLKHMRYKYKLYKKDFVDNIKGNKNNLRIRLSVNKETKTFNHNKKEIDLASTGYYEEIHNRLKSRADVHNNILEDDKVTVKELGGWECAKCHY